MGSWTGHTTRGRAPTRRTFPAAGPGGERNPARGDAGSDLHYDGNAWTATNPGSADLRVVCGGGPASVWAFGGSEAHRFDGTAWRRDTSAPRSVVAASASAADNTWAIADGTPRTIWRHDGSTWSQVAGGALTQPVSVWTSGRRDTWFVERGASALSPSAVYRWDGTAIRLVARIAGPLASVGGLGPGDVWLSADGGLLSYRP